MGGIISSPSPAPEPAPEPVTEVDPSAEDRKRRLENIERRRRGRLGTIETSARGVIGQPQNKSTPDPLKAKLGD